MFDIIQRFGNKASAEQVAGDKGYNVSYTQRLLDALTAMKILDRNGTEQKGMYMLLETIADHPTNPFMLR